MSWTVPGQGYFIEASYINSKYKFKEEGRGNPQRFEGMGNAKGGSVEWNKVISLLTPSETLFSTYKPFIKEQDTWYIMNEERER